MMVLSEDETQRAVLELPTIERGCHLTPIWGTGLTATQPTNRWLLNKHLDRWSYWELY